MSKYPFLQRAPAPDSRAVVRSLVTHDEMRLALLDEVELRPHGSEVSGMIAVDSGETYQSILGFGAAMTDAACFPIDKPEAEKRRSSSPVSGRTLALNRRCLQADFASRFLPDTPAPAWG